MKRFIIYLLLLLIVGGIGWELIGVIPLEFIKKRPDPKMTEFIIKKWIWNMKAVHPHCKGAHISFFESATEEDLIEVHGKCYKWEI